MKQKILTGLFLAFAFQCSAQAGSLQATATDQTMAFNMSQNIAGPLNFDLGYVRNINNSSELLSAGLHLDMGLGPVTGQVGVKAFYTEVDNISGRGYAPGVGLVYKPVSMFSLAGNYYYSDDQYAEDNDIRHYRDWSVTANFHPLSATNLFVGYGYKSVEMAGQDELIMNEGPFVGVSLNY